MTDDKDKEEKDKEDKEDKDKEDKDKHYLPLFRHSAPLHELIQLTRLALTTWIICTNLGIA